MICRMYLRCIVYTIHIIHSIHIASTNGRGRLILSRGAERGTQKYGGKKIGFGLWVWARSGPVWLGTARLSSARLGSLSSTPSVRLGSAGLCIPKWSFCVGETAFSKKNIAFRVGETRLDFLNMHSTCTRSSSESAVVEMLPFRLHRTATYRMHLQSLPVQSASSTA